jgi:major vault protein
LLLKEITAIRVVPANSALRLRAILDFSDENGNHQIAGNEWLFEGPGSYIPRKEVVIDEEINAPIVRPNQAIRLRARKECEDRNGIKRFTGEEWIVKKTGAYLPGTFEEVVDIVNAYILTDRV